MIIHSSQIVISAIKKHTAGLRVKWVLPSSGLVFLYGALELQ